MLRKKELIKKIQKSFKLKSFQEAELYYEKFIKVLQDGLNETDGIKLEKIGIIKKVIKSGREINVPTKEEKIKTKDRIGLSFREDSLYKKK